MPLLATGDYRPDVSDYEGQATRNILNVICAATAMARFQPSPRIRRRFHRPAEVRFTL